MESSQPAATLPECVTTENIPTNPAGILPFYMPTQSLTMATKHLQQAPLQVFNQCVFNNAFSETEDYSTLRQTFLVVLRFLRNGELSKGNLT